MQKKITAFIEFLEKATSITESLLQCDLNDGEGIDRLASNRERLIKLLEQLSSSIDWSHASIEERSSLETKVDYIKLLDEKIITRLQEYKTSLKEELKQTVDHKKRLDGYNLNDVR